MWAWGGVEYATLMSDTLYPNDRVGTGTSPGLWLWNKPLDLSACMSEERWYGEGGGEYDTLM